MKKFLLFGALISLMACSQVDTNVTDAPHGGTNITLGLPNTRTSLGEKAGDTYPIYWSEEDKIVVNGAVSSSVIIDKNRKSATFNFANDILSYPYCITYPYTTESSCAEGAPTVVFAAEQHFVEGTFGIGAAPMCGYCESGGSTSLKHLAGVLQFAIKGSTTLADIEISAADGVALAGEFGVDCQSGAISAIEGKVANKLTYFVNQTLSTTDATACHIVVPAGNLGACKVLLTANNGEQMILKWNASDVKAGVVREFKDFTFKPGTMLELEGLPSEEDDLVIIPPTPRPANNEIWYTSSDNRVVSTYKNDKYGDMYSEYNQFGANIVSNTYENGKGVIKFDRDVRRIARSAFQNTNLASITLPESVESVDDDAFFDCSDLVKFYGKFASDDHCCIVIDGALTVFAPGLSTYIIPNNISIIASGAFYGCSKLKSITIPDSVTTIGSSAFFQCYNLESVLIGEGVETIRDQAFQYCNLKEITLPESVAYIGFGAFYDCRNLLKVYCKPIVPPLVYYSATSSVPYSFSLNSGLKIYVPRSSYDDYTKYSYNDYYDAGKSHCQETWYVYKSYIAPYDF